jgi:hypothetical protein
MEIWKYDEVVHQVSSGAHLNCATTPQLPVQHFFLLQRHQVLDLLFSFGVHYPTLLSVSIENCMQNN